MATDFQSRVLKVLYGGKKKKIWVQIRFTKKEEI